MSLDLAEVPTAFRSAVLATLEEVGINEGHLAIELADEQRIHELNREYRDRDQPTDVLSFPIDEDASGPGPREIGDVVICEAQCENVTEAVVHGVLHLCGYDHETDDGEMLEIQDRIMDHIESCAGEPIGNFGQRGEAGSARG